MRVDENEALRVGGVNVDVEVGVLPLLGAVYEHVGVHSRPTARTPGLELHLRREKGRQRSMKPY